MLEPLKIYDYLTLVRARMFDTIRALSVEDYSREFAIGLGSLARTLTHMMTSEWYYVQRMTGGDVPPYDQWPIREEHPPAFATLESAWSEQVQRTRAALKSISDWHCVVEYRVTDDAGRAKIVSASPADQFTQLMLHEAHHRAQVLNMLRHLGIQFKEDLDFNALMFSRRDAGG